MGIFNNIKKAFGFKRNKNSIVIDTRRSFLFNDVSLADNETIFSAISRLANTMSSLSLELYQNYNTINEFNNDIATLIEEPNRYMTSFNFISTLETLRNTYGNAYSLIEYDESMQPISLYILDNNYVEPFIEKGTRELYYRVWDGDKFIFVHSSNIIHVKYISTTGYKGINPLSVLKNSINYDKEVKEFSINQMQNGLKSNIVIQLKSKLNKDAMDAYTDMLRKFQKNGILFLDEGKEAKELNSNFIDPKVFEVENITIARVARVFNIPLYKLLDGKQSYKNSEQADLEYIKDTILPIVRQYEKEFNRKLLNPILRMNGYKFKFNLSSLKRADMQSRADFYFKGLRSAWFTPNEIRALEDLPPLNGGDKLYVSRDLISIDKIDDLIPKGGD